ncbi:YdcF family protein [Mycolicibacterium fluoranthenivorans]|uniref:Uncharacterized SAM-binding protein YcdF, DUF218 family n=1 Tax=Mycolicibacterium fluoranthenivorans TaxID=258505 RepID=A0A1G4VI93_9MYCO|nr:YdcF family protein [Mycolicibacterium fluoranthenivorans]SCX07214.1 Uncharacterized SAM-binding protein YcdF, DUF218 family [Mycolicibacterium fluoranthenivorans]
MQTGCSGAPRTTAAQRVVPRRRCVRHLAVLACLLLPVAVAVGGLPVYAHPQIDPLRPADAIIVLGGPGTERYRYGRELEARGWAPTLVLSSPGGAGDPTVSGLCGAAVSRPRVLCFDPDPGTTKGEGRELRRLASQYGWHTVIVVTFRPHISRARFILEQCFDGALVMVAGPARISAPRWAFEYVYQSAGFVRAVLQPGC